MVSQALLGKISISPENVHRVEVILELSPEQTFQVVMSKYFLTQDDPEGFPYSSKPLMYLEDAKYGQPFDPLYPYTDYIFEQILSAYQTQLGGVQFDLIHLGLGTDGHMASLFPASDLESSALAQLTFPTLGLEPQVQRISLSLPTINAARVKQFFVTGSSKKSILEQIRHGADYPATRVTNAQWWLDKAASPDE
jgi:6-phosphogluconolactonase/glucosamine-6-phosphate isomerase/deaminase